jgi:hypothetical protein
MDSNLKQPFEEMATRISIHFDGQIAAAEERLKAHTSSGI